MFSYDPNERPSIDEIKKHPWMQEECDSERIQKELIVGMHKRQTIINKE